MPNPVSHAVAAALLCALPAAASAGGDLAATYGHGPDGYHSAALYLNLDVPRLPLQISLDQFVARDGGNEILNESAVGLRWAPTELASASYRYSYVKDDAFHVTGNALGATLNLDRLWQGSLETVLELEAGDYQYRRPHAAAAIASRIPDQRRYTAGIRQELGAQLSAFVSHDEYDYTDDPRELAELLLRRLRNPATPVFVLVSFPERTSTGGIAWSATDRLTLDLSHSSTDTVINQNIESLRLGLNYRVSERFELGVAASQSRTGTIKRPNGSVLVEDIKDSYLEVSAAFSFH